MMKSFLKSLSILSLGLFAAIGPVGSAFANDAAGSGNIGKIVDVTTTVGGNVKDCAESLQEFLSNTKDEKALELVVNALNKAGLDGGWAKQIGGLKKFAGIAGKLLDMIQVGDTVRQLSDVWDDRSAFSEVFADQMTSYAADAVGGLVAAAVKTYGTGLIAGSTVVAPGIGTLLATGGVWLVSWALGEATSWTFEKLAGTDLIRNGMVNLGGVIWDYFHQGDPSDDDDGGGQVCKPGDNPDPFDTAPDNGGSGGQDGGCNKKGYRGLKPLRLVN